jgi:hypothetical protein
MASTPMTLLRRQHAHGAKLFRQHQSRWADKRRALAGVAPLQSVGRGQTH